MMAKSRAVNSILWMAVLLLLSIAVVWAQDLSTKNVRTEESDLANVVVDALRDASGADIAWLPAAAFNEVTLSRDTPPAEVVSKLLPYRDDRVVVLKLTGAQVLQALERALTLYPQPNAGFLQVSGLQVTFDPAKPAGERVARVQVGTENKQELNPQREYRVATSATLAYGALGYFKVWERSAIERETDKTVGDALRVYLEAGKPIAGISERIVAVKP
ncbi:MAG: 5'-nucleotidase [Armatimonadota bacterium]|nr:5'-nucleotidase C-terminal domain-containing protein [bacterium]MDW8320522.1 5'-nucleotidase [Armatimonadota bacterium]